MKGTPKGLIILIAVAALLLIAIQGDELNKIPGIEVKGGGVSVDIGHTHFYTEGVS